MQKAAGSRSPGETLAALHAATGRLMEGSTSSLCLAIVDPASLTLRYARTGEWPVLLLRRSPDSPALPCAEIAREVLGLRIFEGAATLEPGSLMLLYSDGVGRRGSLVRALRHSRFERKSVRMSAGEIVERGASEAVYAEPQHEYTRKLLSAIPRGYTPGARRSA
jgi:serine phosphatase RsbU (regulator of sigma subunit)